jgi:hypothetical protein
MPTTRGSGAPKSEKDSAGRPYRIVTLGGGLAGVYTAKYMTRMLGSRLDVHVELPSEENYFVFQPLLPEVAAGSISPTQVVNPIRDIVPKAQFRWCKVKGSVLMPEHWFGPCRCRFSSLVRLTWPSRRARRRRAGRRSPGRSRHSAGQRSRHPRHRRHLPVRCSMQLNS